MINEASKLRIAIDIIEDKIAKKSIEMRKCEDLEKKEKIKNEFTQLLEISNEIHRGNSKYIDEIIKRNGGNAND